jgi:EmrB/QacA subfamily drug resistance transporter
MEAGNQFAEGGPTAGPAAVAYATSAGRWLLLVTVLGSAMGFLDGTVVNVALPRLGEELNADVAGLQWTLNGYLLSLASLILLGGSLGDRYGRRRIFIIGVIWFTAASLLCAIAPSIGVLIAARVLQGIGGALLTPGSLAIIEASFRPSDRAQAIGAWSALGGIAAALGPLLGGWLTQAASWRWIFLINLPIGLFVVLTAARHVPETRDPTATGKLDVPGAIAASLGLAGVTFALIQGSSAGWGSIEVLLAIGLGVLSLVAFLVIEIRSASPMLPLEIFRSRQFSAANVLTFVVYAALGGVFFLLSVFLQVSLGYGPIEAGAATLPVTLLMLGLSARAGALATRVGPRIPLTIGSLLLAVSMLLMANITASAGYFTGVLPPVIVFGLGLSCVVAPVTATVLDAADERHSGVASAVNNAVSRVAQLLAIAVLPVAAGLTGGDYRNPSALTDGFHTAMLITAGLALAGAVIAWFTIRERLGEGEPAVEAAAEQCSHCAVAGAPLRTATR